ncbi:MAG: spore coat protein [Mollicutes bacterium]|nr:spore coat protein [Mollicutes bacterium]
MNNNIISNPKTPVPETKEMNDCDYLNDVLECEKNLSNNLAIAMNEASHDALYQEIFQIFSDCKTSVRELFNLMFQKGWYSLEKAEAQKINQKYNEISQKLNQLP